MESKFQLNLWVCRQGTEFTSMITLALLPTLMQRNQTDNIQTQKSEQEFRISYVTKS